jgi:hypothetical protein
MPDYASRAADAAGSSTQNATTTKETSPSLPNAKPASAPASRPASNMPNVADLGPVDEMVEAGEALGIGPDLRARRMKDVRPVDVPVAADLGDEFGVAVAADVALPLDHQAVPAGACQRARHDGTVEAGADDQG